MRMTKRRKLRHAVPEIRLTDGLPKVVSRRPRRNRLYLFLSFPVRLLYGFWMWLMESRPSGSHRLRREPPGFK